MYFEYVEVGVKEVVMSWQWDALHIWRAAKRHNHAPTIVFADRSHSCGQIQCSSTGRMGWMDGSQEMACCLAQLCLAAA